MSDKAKSTHRRDPNAKARRERWKKAERRPLHYNKVDAAFELGISRPTLESYSGELFKPAGQNGRINIYTHTQLKIISLVLRGKLTEERGTELWKEIQEQEVMEVLRLAHGSGGA